MSQQLLTESHEKTQQRIAPRKTRPTSAQSFQGGLHPVLQLQRTLGNRRVAQLIQAKQLTSEGKIIGLQRKLSVGAADDQYEQEADRVARQVMNIPDAVAANSMQRAMSPEEDKDQMLQTKPLAASITPFMQRQIVNNEDSEDKENPVQAKLLTETSREPLQRQPEAEEEEKEPIQAKSAGALTDSFEAGADVETQICQSKGRGSPLPDPVRDYMEPRFGVDFSQVRAHTGSDALQMNQAVGAQAFTHGSDIYFGAGSSPTNLELTAHELTHVVQQTGEAPLQTKKQEQPVAPLALRHLSNGVVLRVPKASTPCPTCAANQEEMGQRQAHQEGGAPSERGKGPLNFLSIARTQRAAATVVGDRESFTANRPSPELLKLQPLAGNAAVASLVAQRQPAKKDDDDTSSLRITTANIDDAITIMWKTYQILVRKRRDAVDKLRILVKEDETEPPGVIVALLLQMAAAGVLGPTGMIGAEIANRLINVSAPTSRRRPWKKDPATHAKVANGAIAAVLNTGISEGLKAAYDGLGSPKKKNQDDARELFFLSQRSVLSDKADQVEVNFLNTAAGFRDLEANEKGAGIESLRMLQEAVLKTLSDAEQLQQDESLKAWLSYEANEALGTHEPSKAMWFANKGADLSKIMGTGNPSGEPRRTAGVLSMEIMLSPDYPDRTAVVKSARVEGLNKAMRKRIESIPIGELHIPIVAWARPWGEAWLSVGLNEGRAPWYSIKGMAPEAALRHLYFKVNMAEFAKMRTQEDFDRITRAEMEKSAPYAALRIIEELAPLKLGEAKIPVEG